MLAVVLRPASGIVGSGTPRAAASEKLHPALGKGGPDTDTRLSCCILCLQPSSCRPSRPDLSCDIAFRHRRFPGTRKGGGLKTEFSERHGPASRQGFPPLPDGLPYLQLPQHLRKVKVMVGVRIVLFYPRNLCLRHRRILPDAVILGRNLRSRLILPGFHGK